MSELQARVNALLATPEAIDAVLDDLAPSVALLRAIGERDEAEVGRLIVAAVVEQLTADVQDAIDAEQERAAALDLAEHAQAGLPDALQDWVLGQGYRPKFTLCEVTGDGS